MAGTAIIRGSIGDFIQANSACQTGYETKPQSAPSLPQKSGLMSLFVLCRIRGFCFCPAKVRQSHHDLPGRLEKSSAVVVMVESGLCGTHVSVPQLLNAREYSGGIEASVWRRS